IINPAAVAEWHGSVRAVRPNRTLVNPRPKKEMCPSRNRRRRWLNEDWSTLREVKVTSLWTPLDLIIIPATSSRMPVGVDKPIPALAHPLMVLQRRPLDEVAKALSHPLQRRQLASTSGAPEQKNCRPSR